MEERENSQKPLQEDRPAETAAVPAKKSGKKTVLLATGIALAVLVLAAVVCIVGHSSKKILSGTEMLGVDMSGLTLEEAQERWREQGASACGRTQIELLVDGTAEWQVSLSALGTSVRAEDAAEAAWSSSHSGRFFTDGWRLVRSWFEKTDVLPPLTVDDETLRSVTGQIAEQLSYAAVDASYRLEDGKTDGFYITKAADGRTIDGERLHTDLLDQMCRGDLSPIVCSYTRIEAVPLDLDAVNAAIGGEKVEAGCDKTNGGLIQSRPGVSFDLEQAKAMVEAAEPGQELEIPAEITYPKVTTEELQKVLFRNVLGTCTTSVGGTAARRCNVRLSAAAIDDCILNPGEEFNYNAVVGKRTTARGYQAAPAYVGGKTVDEVGGGICQTSSTLYYAALLSNLQIVVRSAHQFAPSYITFGCDATVSWGGPDFIFRNNTDYPIKIVTYYSGENLTVKIYGTKTDDTYVRMMSKTLSSTDWKTIYQETDELAPGEQRVEQYPYTGYYVKTWRNVYSGDGTLLSSNVEDVSDYDSRNKIVLVGKAAPEPEPTPDPAPDTSPAGD